MRIENKRYIGACIAKLESSHNELNNVFLEVDERVKQVISSIEKTIEEIVTLKEKTTWHVIMHVPVNVYNS